MRTIPVDHAHRVLVSQHKTMKWYSKDGSASLSIRKTNGRFVVRLEDFEHHKINIASFATLGGALVCGENLREYYL